MPVKLFQCTSEAAWAVERLKKGGRIHDISLWSGGVDHPMRIVAKVKLILRAEGHIVAKAIETVRDVTGEDHRVLAWCLANKKARLKKICAKQVFRHYRTAFAAGIAGWLPGIPALGSFCNYRRQ
jgi:hypothetical protein